MENTPIINPLWFYLMGIGDHLGAFLGFLGVIFLIGSIIGYIRGWALHIEVNDDSKEKNISLQIKSTSLKFLVVALFMITLSCLTPSKETVMQMIIAQNITPKVLNEAKKTIGETADYGKQALIELVKTIKQSTEKEVTKDKSQDNEE